MSVQLLSSLDGGSPVDESETIAEKPGSFSTPAFSKLFDENWERVEKQLDSQEKTISRRAPADADHDQRRTHSIKTIDDVLDAELTKHYDGEEDNKAFGSAKGLAARDYLSGAFGDLGKFSDIVERLLAYSRKFKADPIDAAEHFIRDFRGSRFRADRAEQLKADRTAPEISGHRRDWFIEQQMGHVERGDDLTKAQIKELKELFPGTPLDGILDNIATLAKDGFSDPMNVAAKLAHATGAPRTEAELEIWQQQENQRQQQAQSQAQRMHSDVVRIMNLPNFPKSGNQNLDYAAAHEAYYNEQREMDAAHDSIREFGKQTTKYPHFDLVRESMAGLLQHGYAADLPDAYAMAVRPLQGKIDAHNRQLAMQKARRAAPVRTSTGTMVGRAGSGSSQGLDAKLSDAIDRYMT